MSAEQGLRSAGRPAWVAYAIAVVLAGAILFGGGGAEGSLNNGLILAASAALLFTLMAGHWSGARPMPSSAIVPLLLVIGFLLIGAIQLVPVPPGIWRVQPGRELAISSLQLVGAAGTSRSLSLDPEATRRSVAAMLLPAAMMFALVGSSRREIAVLLFTVIGCALISAVIGALQLALGYPSWLTYYEGANSGAAAGVFANVNHQAALLLAAILCVGIVVRLEWAPVQAGRGVLPRRFDPLWLLIPLFVVLVFATGSRAGLLLLGIAVPVSVIVGTGRTSAPLLLAVLAGLGLLAFLLAEASPSGNNLPLGQSLLPSDDKRYAILPDVLLTLKQFWPAGSGLGTFVQVFGVNENLDIAGTAFVNHAHNDMLELLIETGALGLVWLVLAVLAIAARLVLVQLGRSKGADGRLALVWGGFFILATLGLHSLLDYPLRTEAVAAIAGVALGLVFVPFEPASAARPRAAPKTGALALAAIAAVIVGGEVFRIYAAQAAVRTGHGAAAVRVDPANGAALAVAAEGELIAAHYSAAKSFASAAIRRSPLQVRALRVLAIVEDFERHNGLAAWRTASAMGWRDAPTQYWAMRQALANREYATAAIRADALLRTSRDAGAARISVIRALSTYAPFRSELIRRLLLEPRWSAAFFAVYSKASDQELAGVAATLSDLARAGRPVTPRDARSAIQLLIDRRRYPAAVALDRLVTRPGSSNSGVRLDFDQPTDHYVFDVTPFDWNVTDGSGTVVSVEQSESRRVLAMGTDGRHEYQPVHKYVALPPGAYRLGYSIRGPSTSPAAVGLAVYCASPREPLGSSSTDPLTDHDFVGRELRFTVAPDCPLVLIAFEAKPAEGPVEAQFADLSLNRV